MKVTDLQLEMLIERYKRKISDARLSDYGRQVVVEVKVALEELKELRAKSVAIAVEGKVQ